MSEPDPSPQPDLSRLDAKARRFLTMVSVGASNATPVSAEMRRRSFEKLMALSKPPAAEVETSDFAIPGCDGPLAARRYTPHPARREMPGLVYFHGGGLVAGSLATHDGLCRTLAHEAGCRIIAVDYRLAPEHPFPAAILDALVATRWLLGHAGALGLEREAIAVGGDSGGGTLAAITCQVMRRRRLKAQVLLCPVLDFAGAHPSRRAFADGYLLDATTMARDLADYAPRRPLADPRVSPLRAPALEGMPPTLIHTAGFDPLRDEGAAYAARLAQAGVPVTLTCHETLIHHFYGLADMLPAARTALSAIAADIKAALG